MRLSAISPRLSVTAAIAIGLTGLLVASGWTIAHGHAIALFVGVAVVGLCVLALTRRGAFIGVLLVTALNGLPLINTSRVVGAKLTMEDVAIIALFLTAVLWILLDNDTYHPSHIGRALSRAAVPLLLWWVFTLARSVTGQHVPTLRAVAFGRDFLYFALLLLVLPRVQLVSRDIRTLLGILAAAVCLFAIGQIATATGLGQPTSLVHFEYTVKQSGLTRVYSNMTDLVGVGLAVSVTASLVARQRIVRLVASPIALLLTISVVVQLTRARWIGLLAGLFFVSLWLAIHGEARIAAALRKRLLLVVGALVVVGLAAFLIVPGIASSGTVVQRMLSTVSDLESSSGTVAVRKALTNTLTRYLGESWPFGLGLVPPYSHYFVGLPAGSLRDPDVGILNAVMTMGVVGAILIYFPVVFMLIECLRPHSEGLAERYSWQRYGGAVWIVATLISSVTLVTLFSASGLALTAVFLTVLAHPSVSGALVSATAVPPEFGCRPVRAPRESRQPHQPHGLLVTPRE